MIPVHLRRIVLLLTCWLCTPQLVLAADPKWEVQNKEATGPFIVSLAQDLDGNLWVGTEDKHPSPRGNR
jgi:ligand-binding sensor domain-containing protein